MQLELYAPNKVNCGTIIPDFILENKKLCPGAKNLYVALCSYARDKDHCWPSHQTLAKKISCSVSSVKNYLKQLIQQNLIRKSDTSLYRVRSCVYFMVYPQELKRSSQSPKNTTSLSSQNLPIDKSKIAYKDNIKNLNTLPPLPPKPTPRAKTSSYSSQHRRRGDFHAVNKDFEEFYSLYPKKEGKEVARSAWHSLHRQGALPPLDELKKALVMVMASHQWQKDGRRYIPMPLNYLRHRRFEDTLSCLADEQKAQRESQRRQAEFEQKEQVLKTQSNAKLTALRPIFNALATHFTSGASSAAFGLYSYLHDKGIAPSEQDIPKNASDIGLLEWLKKYKHQRLYACA